MGAADLGNLEVAPGTPIIGEGVPVEEKSWMGVGSELTHRGGDRPTNSARCNANKPTTALWRANKPHYQGLVGATPTLPRAC